MKEGRLQLKYIIDIPPDLANKVNTLVSKGKYESLSEFALVSFHNQLLLEGPATDSFDSDFGEGLNDEVPKPESASLIFKFNPEMIKTVAPPTDDKTPNDCLWGQYNRIFPIKITLRTLANLLKDDATVELHILQSQAVYAAREIGLNLREEDEKNERKYGDMFSSALPVGRRIARTENRFVNDFVGNYTRAGRIEGAPGALKFLNIIEEKDGSRKVGITKAGRDFAALQNPILDDKNYSMTLSKAESAFYIENVFKNLKREAQVMLSVLNEVNDGRSSPSELNQAMNQFSKGWSPAMINSIRAGAISRLQELGLIKRNRKGINVRYSLTKFGKEILIAFRKEQGGA